MLKAYIVDNERLRMVEDFPSHAQTVVWADLFNPTHEESKAVEGWLGVEIPTREEMEEIEISSRLYMENGTHFMTAILPAQADREMPLMSPVTFVLTENRLATIRYHEPRAFTSFPQRAEKAALGCTTGQTVLVNLLEAIVDRLADILERAGHEIAEISKSIFHPTEKKVSKRDQNFQIILRRIGRKEDLVSSLQDSLLSLQRVVGFLGAVQVRGPKDARARMKTLSRDVASLSDYADSLSQKITFLLDATLGMINIEQNAIIKIFSVVAVIFLPPTLVASIYGMNFDIMPELKWPFGYPMALAIMVVSAILPFWYFKRRGWL